MGTLKLRAILEMIALTAGRLGLSAAQELAKAVTFEGDLSGGILDVCPGTSRDCHFYVGPPHGAILHDGRIFIEQSQPLTR
jgi:hypothetical protein